jgi:hypothetical protein
VVVQAAGTVFVTIVSFQSLSANVWSEMETASARSPAAQPRINAAPPTEEANARNPRWVILDLFPDLLHAFTMPPS